MSTLHCSSTSFGYMKPSTGICTILLRVPGETPRDSGRPAGLPYLSNRTVHAVVENLRSGRHVRLENLHCVRSQELVNRIFGILQVGELASSGRADFGARCGQPFSNAVIAERAFLRRVGLGIDEAASVGTG